MRYSGPLFTAPTSTTCYQAVILALYNSFVLDAEALVKKTRLWAQIFINTRDQQWGVPTGYSPISLSDQPSFIDRSPVCLSWERDHAFDHVRARAYLVDRQTGQNRQDLAGRSL
jgi:hypothetical protein